MENKPYLGSKEKMTRQKWSGILGTLLFHVGVILILIFSGFYYPDPPPPEEGVIVSLGEPDAGSNSDIQGSPEQNEEVSSVQESSTEEELTQDIEEAPTTSSKKSENPTQPTETNKDEQKTEERKPDSKSLFTKSSKKGGGTGDGDKEGQKGDPTGVDEGNPDVSGSGTSGIKFSLAGRSLKEKITISDRPQESGLVVVDIWVDKNGNVIRAEPSLKSTTTSSKLWKIAKEAALRAKFSPKEDGPEQQKGTITIEFKLR